jgi:HK97 family phage major capsid protein
MPPDPHIDRSTVSGTDRFIDQAAAQAGFAIRYDQIERPARQSRATESQRANRAPKPSQGVSTMSRKTDELRARLNHLADKEHLSRSEELEFDNVLAEVRSFTSAEALQGTRGLSTGPRHADGDEIRSQALRVLEREGAHLAPRQIDNVDRLIRSRSGDLNGEAIARRLVLSETEHYRSAFTKGVTESQPVFTPEEARAISEFRAANEGTGSAGGFGVPVLIDPTIILTSGAADAPLLAISRMITITTDAWKGVSSAGVTWSYDAEASAVSDDTPTLAQPTIPVYMARGFIPYSIEIGQDYPGFADEMSMLLGQGYIDLIASQSMVGSGLSSPRGLFTAMAATTTNPVHIVVKTSGAIGAIDVRGAWAALPERFRPRATWVMSPTVEAQVRAFGNGLALSDFTINLLADGTSVLTGRPVVVSDYAPTFVGTTGTADYAVVGDFSNFVIVNRAGMSVELVPNLFDQATGRPSGSRGWFATARHGFDIVNSRGFVLISNSSGN